LGDFSILEFQFFSVYFVYQRFSLSAFGFVILAFGFEFQHFSFWFLISAFYFPNF